MNFIQTYSSKIVYPLDLKLGDIDIIDIAHSLAMQCRFNGHTSLFYSVSEHSCRVSDLCPAHLKIWGLLHDASEAYLSDMVSPIKEIMPKYKKAEEKILKVIGEKFGLLPWKLIEKKIKIYDLKLLVTEARDLMSNPEVDWASDIPAEPLEDKIFPWTWEEAETQFLLRAVNLGLIGN